MIRSSEPDANISPSWLKLKVLTGQLQPDKRKRSLELNWSLMYKKSNIVIRKMEYLISYKFNISLCSWNVGTADLYNKNIINLSTLLNSLVFMLRTSHAALFYSHVNKDEFDGSACC